MPLEGVRVLDVSQVMAGPFCSMLLGDMGADVIKVEPPVGGDQTRGAMGFKLKGSDSLGFINMNRNKRSIALDLKTDAGREVFYRLAETADIMVENYRPGAAARLGIDYPTLQALNRRLVYASISGFGQTGPWAERPGFDLIAQAMGGVMSITGHPGGPPTKAGVPVADIGCALFALYGILSAHLGAMKTGEGQYVDASLFEAAISLAIWDISEYWGTGRIPTALGTANRMSAPYQAFRAKDGWLVLGANNQRLWRSLCDVLDRPDLMADQRFATIADRLANRPRVGRGAGAQPRRARRQRMGRAAACRRNSRRADPRLCRGPGERPRRRAQHGHGDRPPRRGQGPLDRLSGEDERHPADRPPSAAAAWRAHCRDRRRARLG